MLNALAIDEVDPILSNPIPAETLTRILSHLPQKSLVLCREVCPHWRDVIDLHCPMKEILFLKQDDLFLDRKLELRMTSCVLSLFHWDTPNISLTYPQTIKSFKFSDGEVDPDDYEDDLNVENARGILSQIKPFVHILKFNREYFNNRNILSEPYFFPEVRELTLKRYNRLSHALTESLQIFFSHRFPSLKYFNLHINYLDEKVTDEAYANFFNFLANHRHTLKKLVTKIFYGEDFEEYDAPEPSEEFVLSEEVKGILSKGHLKLESLELLLPPKYVPTWAPIIETQNTLNHLTVEHFWVPLGPGGVPYYSILPGILSSVSTIRTVFLYNIASVVYGNNTWMPLDVFVFHDASNLTELDLRRNLNSMNGGHPETPMPDENEGAWIINLDKIHTGSLKSLSLNDFACKSEELQRLVDNAPVLETLVLVDLLAPESNDPEHESGVHGGIVKSFMDKRTKKEIRVLRSMTYENEIENDKLALVSTLYPPPPFTTDTIDFFRRLFPNPPATL